MEIAEKAIKNLKSLATLEMITSQEQNKIYNTFIKPGKLFHITINKTIHIKTDDVNVINRFYQTHYILIEATAIISAANGYIRHLVTAGFIKAAKLLLGGKSHETMITKKINTKSPRTLPDS